MYRNRSRGVKRLATAVSGIEENARSDSDAEKTPHAKTFPSQPQPKSQRKSGDAKATSEVLGKENQKSPKDGVRGTQGGPEKKRKIDYSQKKTSKAAPSFALDSDLEFEADLALTIFSSKFEELVHKSGCTLREGNQRHLLRNNQVKFVGKLTSLLTDNEDTWDQFMEGLEKHVENNNKFHKLLLETEVDSAHADGSGTQQESLIRMMLGVECIQPKVIALLLSKLADLIQRDPERIKTDNRPWVLLIIKKLCFLDEVVNGQSLQKDLFRLLEVAPLAAKQEIIYNLPYILGEKQDEELAACLINSMKVKKELTPVVLEALGHLPLGQEQSKEIQNKLLQSLKNSPIEFLPVICKFLLFNQNLIMADFDEVINGLRMGLPFTKSGIKNLLKENDGSSQVLSSQVASVREEIASSKTITFHSLRQAVISNAKLLTAWLKNIKSVTSVYHHRPIDIIMLLVMHSTRGTVRKPVELVWKNRITSGMFTESLLEETFDVLLEVLKKHVDELMDVAAFLLRSPDSQICHFGMEMYKLAFVKFDSHLRRRVVRDLIGHVSSKDSPSKAALEVMHELCNKHLPLMADLTICLQNLLEKVYDLDLGSVRRVMDLLCRIAYAPETSSIGGHIASLQDSINIMTKKYLSSHQRQMKHLGVVAAVMAMKHMAAATDENLDATSDTIHSFSSMPPGRICDAVSYFRDVLRNTSCVPEELGYSLDEMSLMIMRTKELDIKYLAHIVDAIESIFMSSYLPDDPDESSVSVHSQTSVDHSGDLEMTPQYGLDKDISDPITLAIGTIVIKEARHASRGNVIVNVSSDIRPITVLSSLFRLLRITKSRCGDEDLSGIDALLGCVVSMPSPDVYEKFEDFSVSQQGDILDCLFHCVNWFREVLNAFLYVHKDIYLPKILIRLRNIVALQKHIARLLRYSLMYTPPMCNFHGKPTPIHLKAPAPKVKKTKKKKKKAKKSKKNNPDATVDEPSENEESSEDEDSGKEVEVKLKEIDVNLYRAYFREIDMHVFQIMSNELILFPRPENGSDTEPEFSPVELRLLLEDLVAKLSHALVSEKRGFPVKPQAGTDEGTIGFGTLNITPNEEVAANAVELFPILLDKLERLQEANLKLLAANDGLLDGPSMFVDNVKNVKVCFGLLWKAIALTLSWTGFQRAQHSGLLTKAVRAMGTRVEAASGRRSTLIPLLEETFSYLRNYPECILDLQSATSFVRLVQVLSDHWERYFKRLPATQQRQNPASEVLHEVTKTFLQQRWCDLDGQPEQGFSYNHQIETLLQVYMAEAPDKIKLIGELAPELSEECVNLTGKDKESTLRTFPVINKSNIHIICSVLLKGTVEGTTALLAGETDTEKQLSIWEDAFNIMQKIVDIVRIHPTRKNQANQLKYSEELLKVFLGKGMPVLESHLRTDQKQVINILQSAQVVTRFNHKVCCTCKISKDNTLLAYVPKVKAVMESVVYRVKSMLALHGAESAWWMGNLKNKDIADHEVGEDDDDSMASSSKKSKSPKSDKKKAGKKTPKKRKSTSPKKASDEEDEDEGQDDKDDKDSDNGHESDETSVSVAY